MDNESVREELRLIITTPDPCDHYEAIVTTKCGSITGAQTSPVVRGKYLSFNTKHVHLHTICTSTYYILYICILYVHLHTICTHLQILPLLYHMTKSTPLVYQSDNVTVNINLPMSGVIIPVMAYLANVHVYAMM